MTDIKLQKQMIINKKHLGWKIRLKSLCLASLTWGIWAATSYFVYLNKSNITQHLILNRYPLLNVVMLVLTAASALSLLAICWSFLSKADK
ncbi:WD-40 repeat-containing protein [Mesocricetibacter intestinalis]|uniref:WD-40 repeat-containing protein n=1 Tax=Mesocricetibacter intestinalis TaxID=1521930 RepID=A0A4R6VBB8_9PAST|nr:peptidylprolyl isomerase [Mesocricetibacter intestinalis]TDQ57348.1 WD-40 repeat-containing protein [Mesocricetibacter intestinalis]